ncbi:MAG: type-4 uracil-DNA glycosylase [Candidatus Asgardarchaeum sp.]
MADKEEIMKKLEELNSEILNCKKCPLHKGRTNAVPGEGNPFSGVMFIGEAPGRQEDIEGRPFVGAAGKLLEKILREKLGVDRSEVYITNVIKCRPPNNRDPLQSEIEACSPYLEKQITLMSPKVIITLGNHSTKYILKKFGFTPKGITKLHGQVLKVDIIFQQIYIYPTFHPAAVLYNRQMEYLFVNDMIELKKLLDKLGLPIKS